jgi:D-aminopeptidase
MRMDRRTLLKLLPISLLSSYAGGTSVVPFHARRARARELGIRIGTMQPGRWNAITDVPGVKVGQTTLIRGNGPLKVGEGPVRTGVTVVVPHERIYDEYIHFGFHILNGNGEVTGLTQAANFGILASPICTTNTSSVGMVYDAMLSQFPSNERQLLPVVGETWDAFLNDIEGRHVHAEHVIAALQNAASGPVAEGCVGGGTGMICYEFKGGIGTASRKLPGPLQQYTVGVLVQANHGSREDLRIDGVPVGEEIANLLPEPDEAMYMNSILIIVATDAPLLNDQLNRLARRGGMGLSKTGSISSNSSGDFILAFSTANRIKKEEFWNGTTPYALQSIEQFDIQPIFQAVSEATEEAIINAIFMATDMVGCDDHRVYALPIDRVLKIMQKYHRLFPKEERKVAAL